MKHKKRFQSKLSDEQWAAIKQKWETDPFLTFAEIGRTHKPSISAQAVAKRAKRDEWVKRISKQQNGRPTAYRSEFDKQAYKLTLLGATDKQLADFFNVSEKTINNWKRNQLSFFQSLRDGKTSADAKVAQALYLRAIGYKHEETHFATIEGEIVQTTYTKHYPPCVSSAIFWLKNRQPALWKDKVEVKEEIDVNVFPSREELDDIYDKALAEADAIEKSILKGRAKRLGINLDGMEGCID